MRWLRLALYLVPFALLAVAWYFLTGLRAYDEVDPGAITFAISTEPIGIDPLTGQDPVSEEIENLLFDTLIGRSPEMEVERRLAESWTYSSRARYFFLTPRHAGEAWISFEEARERWDALGITGAELLGDEIAVSLSGRFSETADEVLKLFPGDLMVEVAFWDITTSHSARSAFDAFRRGATEAGQIRRTWDSGSGYLEAVSAGNREQFQREMTNWYGSNPELLPRVELSRTEPFLFETFMTVNLRSDAHWHDGTPLTVQDVMHSLELARVSGDQPLIASTLRAAQAVEARGPLSLRVTWRQPYAPALEIWERLRVLPSHASHLFPDPSGRPLTGTGPYRIRQWTQGRPILLERNKDYFLGAPENQRLIYDRVIENRLRRLLFETKAIDSYAARPATYERLESRPDYELVRGNMIQRTRVAWNLNHGPLTDARVRRALAHAVDVPTLIRNILGGHGDLVRGMFHPDVPAGTETWEPLPHNLHRARALLDQAGYRTIRSGNRYSGNAPLKFTLTRTAGDEFSRDLALHLQRAWEAVGANVTIHIAPWGEMSAIRTGKAPFEAVLLTDPLEPHLDLFGRWHSSEIGPGRGNFCGLRNQEVDFILERIRREFDPVEAQTLAASLQERLHQLQPECDIFMSDTSRVFQKNRIHVLDKTPPGQAETRPVGQSAISLTHDLAWWVKQQTGGPPENSEPAAPPTTAGAPAP